MSNHLSRFFTLEEMLVSQTAIRKGIDMTPPPNVKVALRALCNSVLDPLREEIGQPIIVSSGFRPVKLNTLIGGSRTSQHCLGEAADINVRGWKPIDLAHLIVNLKLPFDQVIMEFGQWVHVSHKAFGSQRGQALTARRTSAGVHYLPGLLD
jgi:hypothetical protein